MGNALSAFFGAMLRKREQDLEAALANERMRYKAMESLGEGIGNVFGAIGDYAMVGLRAVMVRRS
jgi:hypothetical protein